MKFYVLRTSAAYITEVVEIEADDHEAAVALVDDGDGKFLGVHVGDYVDGHSEEVEVLPAAPQNIPADFYPVASRA